MSMVYRIDDQEIYSVGMNSSYVGEMVGLDAITIDGVVLFSLKEE